MDLEKAFDRVDNCMILNKLHSLYGLRADACWFICSFIAGRKQYVCVNGVNQHLNGFGSLFLFADDVQILFTGDSDFTGVLQAWLDG